MPKAKAEIKEKVRRKSIYDVMCCTTVAARYVEGDRRWADPTRGLTVSAEDAVCNLGVADWKGREAIRANLKAFIDTGFTALHHVTEYWDGGR